MATDHKKLTLGIIGQGSFGTFVAKVMKPYFTVRPYTEGADEAAFKLAAKADFVVLAVPFEAYGDVLPRLREAMLETSVLVDVCSVKLLPLAMIEREMPGRQVLATHPLFGPQSAASSLAGHQIIICPPADGLSRELYYRATAFFDGLGLNVMPMPPDDHDKLMADLQGLTFYVAQALASYGVNVLPVMTPSYRRLAGLAELERHHSAELFQTIQNANPHAAAARRRFRDALDEIEAGLTSPNGGNAFDQVAHALTLIKRKAGQLARTKIGS